MAVIESDFERLAEREPEVRLRDGVSVRGVRVPVLGVMTVVVGVAVRLYDTVKLRADGVGVFVMDLRLGVGLKVKVYDPLWAVQDNDENVAVKVRVKVLVRVGV